MQSLLRSHWHDRIWTQIQWCQRVPAVSEALLAARSAANHENWWCGSWAFDRAFLCCQQKWIAVTMGLRWLFICGRLVCLPSLLSSSSLHLRSLLITNHQVKLFMLWYFAAILILRTIQIVRAAILACDVSVYLGGLLGQYLINK